MDGIRITGKSLGCHGCDGEFASAAQLDRHEAETGHGIDDELAEGYSAELRGGRGDALDVVWRGIDVGLLVREGEAWVAVLHSADESGPRRETAAAALADLRAMHADAMGHCGWCGCPTDRAGREEVYGGADAALCAGCRAERDGGPAHRCEVEYDAAMEGVAEAMVAGADRDELDRMVTEAHRRARGEE